MEKISEPLISRYDENAGQGETKVAFLKGKQLNYQRFSPNRTPFHFFLHVFFSTKLDKFGETSPLGSKNDFVKNKKLCSP